MGPEIYLSVQGADRVEHNLNAMARSLEPAEMMKTFGIIVKGIEEYEKSTWGHNVKDTPQTRERWPEGTTLVNTGDLKRSMTASDAPGAIRDITPFGFRFGTSLSYARFVNDGTVRQSPKPFLKLNVPIRLLIRKVISERVGRMPDARYSSGFRDL